MAYLLYDSIYESLMRCRERAAAGEQGDRQYAARFLAGALTGVVQEYCAAEPPYSAEELYRVLYELFSGKLFR